MMDFLKDLDTKLFLFLNQFHSPFWDQVMWLFSGKLFWLPLYIALLAVIIYKYRKSCWFPLLAIALVILFSDQIASGIIKPLVERLRPSREPSLKGLVHIVNSYKGGQFGFASSHASNTFGLAVFTSLLFKNRLYTGLILIWAVIVSYSRIYLGVHYPGDVLAGALIGTFSAYAVYFLFKILSPKILKST